MRPLLKGLLPRASRAQLAASTRFSQVSISRPSIRRSASTDQQAAPTASRLLNFFYGTTLVLGLGIVYVYVTDTRASIHRYVVIPALRLIYRDAEEAHHAGNHLLKSLWDFGLHPRERGDPDGRKDLETEVFGQILRNPLATSAGIDKHADIPDALFAIGPAVIEIGGTTPLPQNGNPQPRVFRLTSQQALINRYGLNSEGADHVAMRLRNRVRKFAQELGLGHDEVAEKAVLDGIAGVPPGSLTPGKLLAVNIAKNKITPEDDVEAVTRDYVYCVDKLGPYADILVVNVSSPNTPGLRSLQQSDKLQQILTGVVKAAHSVERRTKPKIMVKVSPDEDTDEQVSGICEAVWASGVDGVIVGNTTNKRPETLPHLKKFSPLEEQHLLERGGFSGPHLFDRTVSLVKKYRKLLAERPTQLQPPEKTPSALEAEVKHIEASIPASIGPAPSSGPDPVVGSVDTGIIPLRNPSEKSESEKQPLISLPDHRFYDKAEAEPIRLASTSDSLTDPTRLAGERVQLQASQEALDRVPPQTEREATDRASQDPQLDSTDQAKVIFATGGITNGKQALEVLDAGADVAMIYTALVYGGVGTISRVKDEMREEIQRQGKEKRIAREKS
ncbi:uncharacterized protein A1O9_03677 [Exophiala aquamarina CBS 119918]|uniref:Dihydroorotate dehydrogenase (quinone), mitochondrial n=1 Tax=Exophiala aquamarina CBS 119918 TaxID=1182545 RepID=A0A072PFF9_9EURO|nr:uncharacterized protein A1O9_03677 [Exophiala aquamarina CBS 119918]KEF58834.1 hypothetical protein A1O9_03677 [Exophiala aquamarina CBS 119918]